MEAGFVSRWKFYGIPKYVHHGYQKQLSAKLYYIQTKYVLSAGVGEVCDGKSETYIDITRDILSDISQKEDESENNLNNVSCFMTDNCGKKMLF